MAKIDVTKALESVMMDLNYIDPEEVLDEGKLGDFLKGAGRAVGNGIGTAQRAVTSVSHAAGNALETDDGIKRQGLLLINKETGAYLGVRGVPAKSDEANDVIRMYQAQGFVPVTDQERDQAIQNNVKIQVVAPEGNEANVKAQMVKFSAQILAAAQKFDTAMKNTNVVTASMVGKDPNFHAIYIIGRQIVQFVEQSQSKAAPAAPESVNPKVVSPTSVGKALERADAAAPTTSIPTSGGASASAPVSPVAAAPAPATPLMPASLNPAPIASGAPATTFGATPETAPFRAAPTTPTTAPASGSLSPAPLSSGGTPSTTLTGSAVTPPEPEPAPVVPGPTANFSMGGSTPASGTPNGLGYQGVNQQFPAASARYNSLTPDQKTNIDAQYKKLGKINPYTAESVDFFTKDDLTLLTESVGFGKLDPLDIF